MEPDRCVGFGLQADPPPLTCQAEFFNDRERREHERTELRAELHAALMQLIEKPEQGPFKARAEVSVLLRQMISERRNEEIS